MDHERWNKLKNVFANAVEMEDRSRRLAYIHDQCTGDAEMEKEVLSLLENFSSTDKTLENPLNAVQLLLSQPGDLPIPKFFGNYRIIREIGRGGMGSVFLAERSDGEFSQRVALKIIRHSLSDEASQQRFRRERELLAGLSHSNIARLYDGGVSENGEPFFVMEYIEGSPLMDYVRSQNLKLRPRLLLFLKLCAAVSYAHRNLIIHRDLKPQNILVNQNGEPKLLDFGLAKLIDESSTEQTATQFRAFTPAYASPEQILGKRVSVASDIYSLGVILFELLTNQRPFENESKSLDQLLNDLTENDPPKPSTFLSGTKSGNLTGFSIDRDLDTIVVKCLAPEPERRYLSVDDLINDIGNYLDSRPITARPSTFRYKAGKFVRRNKTAVTAAFLVVLALTTGTGISLWQAHIARLERDRAERRFQDVRRLSTSLLFEITPKIETLEGSLAARETLVARSLEYLDSLASEAGNDEQLLAELAAAYEKIGELQGHHTKPNTGDLAGALESYQKANRIRQFLPPTAENRRLLAENFRQLSDARWWQGDTKTAKLDVEAAISIYDRLINENPDNPDYKIARLRTLNDLAQWYQAANNYPEAISIATRIINESSNMDVSQKDVREIYYVTHADLGNSLSWNGEQQRAEKEMATAVEGVERLIADFPSDARLRHIMWRVYSLASVIYEDVNNPISLDFALKALKTAENALLSEPRDIQAKHNRARSTYRIGVILVNLHRSNAAIERLSQAELLMRDLINYSAGNNYYRSDLGRIYLRKGLALQALARYPESNSAFAETMKIWEAMKNDDPANKNVLRDIATTKMYIGDTFDKMNRKDEAASSYRDAIEIMTDLKNQNSLPEVDLQLIARMQRYIGKLR